jgi:HNH endonuclease
MRHDADCAVLAVSRKTRTIPPSIRRALAARDTSCRFPGCTSRRCDAHHVEHWANGGATCLDNLVLLCRRHHRAVHEGGFCVIRGRDGAVTFLRPDGAPLDVSGTPPTWDGAPFDLPWAIDVLYRPGAPASTV